MGYLDYAGKPFGYVPPPSTGSSGQCHPATPVPPNNNPRGELVFHAAVMPSTYPASARATRDAISPTQNYPAPKNSTRDLMVHAAVMPSDRPTLRVKDPAPVTPAPAPTIINVNINIETKKDRNIPKNNHDICDPVTNTISPTPPRTVARKTNTPTDNNSAQAKQNNGNDDSADMLKQIMSAFMSLLFSPISFLQSLFSLFSKNDETDQSNDPFTSNSLATQSESDDSI